ncbi:MAG: radical SAM protein, partial [Nitrospiraceae bacterium]|nr:radical SAM protein [Nitrospiraceae bacterium]
MCKHCMGKYLHGMTTITNPEKLIDFCVNLEGRGGKGILVSGGSDSKGRIIGLEKSLNALKRVREETDLVIAVHAGYVDRETAD